MEKKICANPDCGKEFISSRSDQKYCCEKCRDEAGRKKIKKLKENPSEDMMKKRICPICGKEFLIFKYSQRKYCSKNCAQQARDSKRTISKDMYEYYANFAERPEPTERFHLCWKCRNAVPNPTKGTGCSWSKNYIPVTGWTAVQREVHKIYNNKDRVDIRYTVKKCPLFKAG